MYKNLCGIIFTEIPLVETNFVSFTKSLVKEFIIELFSIFEKSRR